MSAKQTTDSLALTAFLAGAFGLVAFGLALAIGKWDLAPSAAVGVAVAMVVGVLLMIAFHAPAQASVAIGAHATPVDTPAAPPAPKVVEAPAAKLADVAASSPAKPAGLSGPRGGKADDLKLIKGVGPKLEALLHRLGYFHFDQIAAWSAAEVAWVDDNLEGFKGRVSRDSWVDQARHFAAGGTSAHAEAVKSGKIH